MHECMYISVYVCWLTKSVLQLKQKNYYNPWNLGGLNPSFFVIWGGLAPPSPYVEPPLQRGGGHKPDSFCGRHKWMAPYTLRFPPVPVQFPPILQVPLFSDVLMFLH